MKEETIERIARQYQGDNLPASIAKSIHRHSTAKARIGRNWKRRQDEIRRHESEMAVIRRELREIQESCPHFETTFHGDPSGGNDSYTDCDVCGKEIR